MDEDTALEICNFCGKEEYCTHTTDPYMYEVFGDTRVDWWCGNCLYERSKKIGLA